MDEEKTGGSEVKARRIGSIGTLVDRRITRLLERMRAGQSSARRDLAALRMAVNQRPGESPEIWALTEVGSSKDDGLEPTAEEWAVHIAMCLFGTHQQGQSQPAHNRTVSLGQAVRILDQNDRGGEQETSISPVWRRFTAAMLSNDIQGVREHLQGLIGQLHSSKSLIPLDYAALAEDLVRMQRPGGAGSVRLQWQRDFYYVPTTKNNDNTESKK
ncbi:type I-E CRISPR-associated protein Cse2/CasB [Actinomyces sp. F1_1611]